MNKFKYLFMAAALGFTFTACDDDDDNYGALDNLDMIVRSQSIADGATVRPYKAEVLSINYNNVVGINPDIAITLNGEPVNVSVNSDNHMQIVIDLQLSKYTEYTLEIPQGAIFCAEKPDMVAAAKTIKFDTNAGIRKSMVATSLHNPSATPEAVNVYNFLLENYGQKQLSGSMGEVAWGLGFTELVAAEAGKYPAIVGFDYIHLSESPANWIDYSDITPVQTVWNNNGIPAMTWHWNVPHSEVKAVKEIWKGETATGEWANSVIIAPTAETEEGKEPVNIFDDVQVGQSIMVTFKNASADAQGSLKNSDWAAIDNGTEYFNISGERYTWTISKEMLDQLKEGGLIVGGKNHTITGVFIAEGDESKGGFSCDNTKFKPSNVMVEGSWENKIATADIEKLAGYLKLLQDANIPVLWRPFHEAAGDYTWGAWFWWGSDGVEVTKKLWVYLHDKLTNEYGLNNLIWVWTMQTSDAGNLADVSKLIEAYPGDEYVDIVCTDLYEDAFTNHTDQFDIINSAVGCRKIIALGEVGNMLDIDSTAADKDNAMWSYFMGWYEQDDNGPAFLTWNTNGEWKTIMENAFVINRDNMPSLK